MSLHYIIDGYNVIYQMAGLADLTLQEQRRQLVLRIENARPQGSGRNRLTIVFDGSTDVFGFPHEGANSVEIVFAKGKTADEEIKDVVAAVSGKNNAWVVTDDRALQYAVRALGAQVIAVRVFLKRLRLNNEGKSIGARRDAEDQKTVTVQAAARINDELRNVWLKEGTKEKR